MTCEVTYEELARFSAGEASAERTQAFEAHLRGCEACQRRLQALADVDTAVQAILQEAVPGNAVVATWRAVAEERGTRESDEVMTLEEVAAFLKVSRADLEQVLDELPAFELAGHIRVRRSSLQAWMAERERRHRRGVVLSLVSAG